jgi:phosphatidylinositol alpha-1,6-mannosyltransferase
MHHLLVTNDFPPKVGGIQSYLWELWRRLPPERVTVVTRFQAGAEAWDAAQPFRVVRARDPVLLPRPGLVRRVNRMAAETGAGLVMLDPALPLGELGPHLDRPFGLVLHGAEIGIPARVPGARRRLARLLVGAQLVVAAGAHVASEARRVAGADLCLEEIPPGVDPHRFRPLGSEERVAARRRFGLPVDGRLVVSVGRLVPRKGMDVLIRAAARLVRDRGDVCVAIAGTGRDRARLAWLNRRLGRPVKLLGRVPDAELGALYGCADLFALLCRDRPSGLAEGFGIVFLEAAAAGVPQIAGGSGGASLAVADGVTGRIVRDPSSVEGAEAALAHLLDDPVRRRRAARASRARAILRFSCDNLAARLEAALESATRRSSHDPRGPR